MLQNIEQFDLRLRLAVSGYIRQIHHTLAHEYVILQSIPELVILNVLSFYDWQEKFEIIGIHTQVSDDQQTITKTKSHRENTSYGAHVISSTSQAICRWDLKINFIRDQGFRVGVCSDHTLTSVCFPYDVKCSSYAYMASGGSKVSKGQDMRYGVAYKTNDIVGIELNLKKRCVRFYCNNRSPGIAFDNIDIGDDIKYRLAVSMYGNQHSVTIENFEYLNE